MKTNYCTILFILIAHCTVSFGSICPDSPINDDPCILSDNPPFDLTNTGTHSGTTCCATPDLDNINCNQSTASSVWYIYTPNPIDAGYTIQLMPSGDGAEGQITVEVYSGPVDQGCNGGFEDALATSCIDTVVNLKIGNCFEADEVIFIKVSTNEADENCGEFTIEVSAATCENAFDNCIDLQGQPTLEPITNLFFSIDYFCVTGCLDFACPETDSLGGCSEFMEMPTVWFQVKTDDIAAQLFTTVEPTGNWEPIWSVFSGPDCDNLSLVNVGGTPGCSNGDNTPDLHQTSVFDDEENYWIMVTVDPNSFPATGLDDGSFELCASTTLNAIICLGELEGGACDDESLVIEITERDNEDMSLDGPFCPGEEVEVNISFFYDASESGADWFIGFVPTFGPGWDMENFDYNANPPVGNGQTGEWYEEGGACAPIIQEPNPILCTFTDENGNLQLCNQLCSPCSECPQKEMMEGDPLPSGYFWVSNGGNAGCDNDCSPGEGWGIGSTMAQIDWNFKLRVKKFEDLEDCFDNDKLFISFQTFSDGVAGCWEDPVGECLLDRAMYGPIWTIGCSETPPAVIANDLEICTEQVADIAVNTENGSQNAIIVKALDNPNITGGNDYEFENGAGIISDSLVNNSEEDQILQYEVFAIDSTLACNGPKTVVNVLVRTANVVGLENVVCSCEDGCTTIGIEKVQGEIYLWSTGSDSSMIVVCPTVPTSYTFTTIDTFGCEHIGTVMVDCEGMIEACDSIIVIIDLDMDGFSSEEDCDDENADINPDAEEIPNNDVDEDCDGIALIIDVDMDGFNSDDDCDDENANINPDAVDIPDNGIDEDCDGMDAVTAGVSDLGQPKVLIYPNPSNDAFTIAFEYSGTVEYIITDAMGKVIEKGTLYGMKSSIDLGDKSDGLYLLVLKYKVQELKSYHKLIKI